MPEVTMLRVSHVVLAAKLGPKVFALGTKALKSAKAVKVGLGGASMASYAWLFTWEFALLILVSLVIHEVGHVRAMKAVGIPTKGFYLIPFVGGAAVPDRAFRSRNEEQFVALYGPLFGLAQGAVFYLLYVTTAHPLAAAIASWVCLFNLINMLPVSPLDGGRVMKSIAFSIHSGLGLVFLVVSVACLAAVTFYLQVWLIGLILVIALFELLLENRTFCYRYVESMSIAQSLRCFLCYAFICGGLVAIMLGCAAVPEAALALDLLRDG